MNSIDAYDNDRSLHQFSLTRDGKLRWHLPGKPADYDLYFDASDFAANLQLVIQLTHGSVGPVGPCGLRREGKFVGISTVNRLYWFGTAAQVRLNHLLRRPNVRKVVSV